MQITRQTVSGVEVFTAQGQLDATTSPQLEAELLAGVQTGATRFVVDLEHVSLISSAALRVLLSMAKRMRRQHGKILLCAPSAEVQKVFEVSDLSSLFDVYPTQADALAATVGDEGDPAAEPGSPVVSPPPAPLPPVPTAITPIAATAPVPPPGPVVHVPLAPEAAVRPPPPVQPPPPPSPQPVPPAQVTVAAPPPAAAIAAPPPPPPQLDPSTEDNGGETLVATGALQSEVAQAVAAARALAPANPAPPPPAVVPPKEVTTPPPPVPATPSPVPPVLRAPLPVEPAERPVVAPIVPPPPRPVAAPPPSPPLPVAATPPPPPPPPATLPKPALIVPPAPAQVAPMPPPPLPPPGASPRPVAAPPAVPVPAGPSRNSKSLVLLVALGVCILGVFAGGAYWWRSLGNSKRSLGANSTPPAPTLAPATPTPASTPTPRPAPTPTLTPTPRAGPVVSAPTPGVATPEPSAAATLAAGEEAARIVAPARVNLDPAQQENQEVRASVLKRIELMPVSQRVKDQLYAAVDRARRMGKVITITFGSGRTELSAAEVEKLRQAIQQPSVQELVNDPTMAFVVLGYADTKGNEQTNQQISERRAQKTLEVLRSSCGLLNTMHSVGMGGSNLFDKQRADRNRAVEIWAVLP